MGIENGNIYPGKGISNVHLGMTYRQICAMFPNENLIDQTYATKVVKLDNAKLWFDKEDILYQITVFGSFLGKMAGTIGIGSTLKDIKRNGGQYSDEFGVYILKEHKGICFELEDADEGIEEERKIEYISVYKN